jgi:hypothetical protein
MTGTPTEDIIMNVQEAQYCQEFLLGGGQMRYFGKLTLKATPRSRIMFERRTI